MSASINGVPGQGQHPMPPAVSLVAAAEIREAYVVTTYDEMTAAMCTARIQRGLSVAELSRKIGRSPATVYFRENGQRMTPSDELLSTMQTLGWQIALIPPK